MNANNERIVRGVAGLLVVVSVLLAYLVSPYWVLLAGFVGASLFQSAFTDWCLLMELTRRFNGRGCDNARAAPT